MTDNPKIAGLSSYLEHTGWERRPVSWRGSTVWLHSSGGVASVPKQVMGDFELRYLDAVEAIARAEGRNVTEVLDVLQGFHTDKQSFRIIPRELPSGFIGLSNAVRALESIANIYRYVARSIVEGTNSEFKGQAPGTVTDLVKQMRLGQPAEGSYVFKVHVPLPVVPHQLQLAGLSGGEDESDGGLAREVMIGLHRTVDGIAAAQRAYLDDSVEVQATELIELGVSADLCDSLAKLSLDESSSPFEIGFHWAYGVKGGLKDGTIGFTEGAGTYLKNLAARVRRVKQGVRARLSGEVVQLNHGGRDEPYLAKIKGTLILLSGSPGSSEGNTWVVLDQHQYELASHANRHHLRVEAEGVFELQRNRFELDTREGIGAFTVFD